MYLVNAILTKIPMITIITIVMIIIIIITFSEN